MTTIRRAKRASQAQREATKRREGRFDANGNPRAALRAFQDPGDPVTIGWGWTGEIEINGERRKPRLGDQITPEYADKLFEVYGVPMAENRIDKYFPNIPLTQGQRDALFDFCYNISLRTLSGAKGFTLGRLINNLQISKDLMLEWFPKYRNPRTVFEQGLFRRRIWNACVFLGCDVEISEKHAWTAELRRDDRGEISFATDPQLIYLRSLNDTEKVQKAERERIAEERARAQAEEDAKRAAEEEARKEAEKQAEADAKAEQSSQREPVPDTSTEPRKEPAPTPAPAETPPRGYEEPEPEKKKAPRVYKKRLPASPKAPKSDPDSIQLNRPEFWSLQLLLFGRVALAFGLVPQAFSDLILDPAFQSAFGGAIAIYLAMYFRRRARKQRERREAKLAEERG